MSAGELEDLDALVSQLSVAAVGRQAIAEQAGETHRSAMVELEEAQRLQVQAKAVADLGAELIGVVRAWHRIADRLDMNHDSMPGPSSSAYRTCAGDVERLVRRAVSAVEL